MMAFYRVLGMALVEGWDIDPIEETLLEFSHGLRTCPHCGAQERHPFQRPGFYPGGHCTCKRCGEVFPDPKI